MSDHLQHRTEAPAASARRSRLVGVLAALALAALALTAAPAAAEIRVFEVTAEGSGSYDRYDELLNPHTGEMMHHTQLASSFSWKSTLPRVVFDSESGELLETPAPPSVSLTGSASADQVTYGKKGDAVIRNPGSCSAPSQQVGDGWASLRRAPGGGPEPGVQLLLRPIVGIGFAASCSGTLTGIPSLTIWAGNDPETAFDHHFFMPKLALQQDLIIQHVAQQPSQAAACASWGQYTKTCSLQWSGKVTFRLVEVQPGWGVPGEDGLVVPLEPQNPDEDSLVVPLTAVLAPDGSKASVKLRCPTGCAGTLSAYAPKGAKAGASAKPRPLAKKRFKARAGRATTVTLRFRGKARAAVRRAGSVRLEIRVGGRTRSLTARMRG